MVVISHKALNPDYESRTRDSFNRQPLMALIGAEMHNVQPGYCEIHLPMKTELAQQHGFLHGGMVSTLLDATAGYASHTLLEKDAAALTVEYKVNILRPGRGTHFVAKAQVIKSGKTLFVVQAELFDQDNVLLATSLQTLIRMTGMHDELHYELPTAT